MKAQEELEVSRNRFVNAIKVGADDLHDIVDRIQKEAWELGLEAGINHTVDEMSKHPEMVEAMSKFRERVERDNKAAINELHKECDFWMEIGK